MIGSKRGFFIGSPHAKKLKVTITYDAILA